MKIKNNDLKNDTSKNTNKIKKLIHNNTFIASLFIIIVSIIASIPMFNPNYNIQFNDGIQHICRLIGTEQSIKEGELIPVIMSNFCNDFGYSWNLFYSPVTSYVPLIFRLFTSSYEMCLKLFITVVSIVTGFAMYFFMKKFLKGKLENKKIELISILGAVLYILLPYRLNDMYLRTAVAEITSFIFLPIVFNGLYSIINLKEKSNLLIIGGAGMLLTHSLLTVYLVIFCLIYFLINIRKIDKKIIITLAFNAILILLITAFYWVPLLQTKLSADYEVFNQAHMIRWDAMISLKPKLSEIAFYVPGRMYYGIGILVILGTALSFTLFKRKNIDRKNYIFFLICGLVSIIMSLDFFPFEKLPSIFTMMQFSFRMIEFGGFFLAIVSSIAIGLSIDKFNIYTIVGFTCITIALLLPNLKELVYGRYYTEDELIKGISVTSKTGRVHAGCASFEYLPSKAFENRKYIEDREDAPIILNFGQDEKQNEDSLNLQQENNRYIQNFEKNGTSCSFNVIAVDSKELQLEKSNLLNNENYLEIELPYIYYIGYNVEYIDKDGNSKIINTYESKNGFLCIKVPNENLTIKVKYTGTILMKIAYIVSIFTTIISITILIINKKVKIVNKK